MAEVCGFIGLGDQGAPIARRMVDAGYPMLLWARRDEALEPFRSSGAEFMASIEGQVVLDDGSRRFQRLFDLTAGQIDDVTVFLEAISRP